MQARALWERCISGHNTRVTNWHWNPLSSNYLRAEQQANLDIDDDWSILDLLVLELWWDVAALVRVVMEALFTSAILWSSSNVSPLLGKQYIIWVLYIMCWWTEQGSNIFLYTYSFIPSSSTVLFEYRFKWSTELSLIFHRHRHGKCLRLVWCVPSSSL